jgi:hypothetical protein
MFLTPDSTLSGTNTSSTDPDGFDELMSLGPFSKPQLLMDLGKLNCPILKDSKVPVYSFPNKVLKGQASCVGWATLWCYFCVPHIALNHGYDSKKKVPSLQQVTP